MIPNFHENWAQVEISYLSMYRTKKLVIQSFYWENFTTPPFLGWLGVVAREPDLLAAALALVPLHSEIIPRYNYPETRKVK